MKYAFIDVEEDEEGCTFDSKKEVMEYIEEWNEDMETDYKSIFGCDSIYTVRFEFHFSETCQIKCNFYHKEVRL